eukprot:jgi/Bigna1/71074/fgenesh1_pg.14_\
MVVKSLPQDKPKIVFHAAMMAIQNFGFMIFYYDIWGQTPHDSKCQSTRDAVAMMSVTCFCVAFLCVGMAFGGYTDDQFVFALYWFAHLAGGAAYTICTITIPIARYSSKGKDCAALAPLTGDRIEIIYILHALLYFVYVGGMLSITYFSFIKPTYYGGKVLPLTESKKANNAD